MSALIKNYQLIKKSQQGFSIVEILLILMIIGFIVSLINLLPSSLKLVGSSNHESIAKEIAQKKIEDLRLLTYDNICDPTSGPCTDPISDVRLSRLPNSSGQALIESCPTAICTGNELAKKITVSVTWKEINDKANRNVSLTTLIAKDGLK